MSRLERQIARDTGSDEEDDLPAFLKLNPNQVHRVEWWICCTCFQLLCSQRGRVTDAQRAERAMIEQHEAMTRDKGLEEHHIVDTSQVIQTPPVFQVLGLTLSWGCLNSLRTLKWERGTSTEL